MKRKSISVALMIALILTMTACAGQTQDTVEKETADTAVVTEVDTVADSTTPVTDEADTYPITIQHAFGETVIASKPERVATIAWSNQDTSLALGVVPVGVSEANYGVTDGSGLLPWTKAAFEELGVTNPVLFRDTAGLDFEAISDVQPDVILAAYSGITQEEYDLLSQIAPVVAYPTLAWQTYWRDQILMDAAGMGMKAEGEALVSELESLITEKVGAYSQLEGKNAAFIYFNPSDLGTFYVYLPTDPRAAYLTDLGLEFSDSVLSLASDSDSFALLLSAENADVLQDVDIIITYGNEELLAAMQKDPLLSTIPAVQRGSVVVVEDGTPLAASGTPSALSIPATIDEYLSLIVEAADKVK